MNNANLVLAMVISIGIMVGWNYFYQPQITAPQSTQAPQQHTKPTRIEEEATKDVDLALKDSPRVYIGNAKIKGSINLKGLRFDDIELLDFKGLDGASVRILSPSQTTGAFFVETGFISEKDNEFIPGIDTVWQEIVDDQTSDTSKKFIYSVPGKITYMVSVKLDENYMFELKQQVINHDIQNLKLASYCLTNRLINSAAQEGSAHKGSVGILNGSLEENSYESVVDKAKNTQNVPVDWIGITDKYLISAIIPDQKIKYDVGISRQKDKFQVDLVGPYHEIKKDSSLELVHRLFVGVKEVKLLDQYETKCNIRLFDRAVDFGWFYAITKPLFYLLSFFYSMLGNFGLSIMFVTVLVKMLTFPLTYKSGKSIKALKNLTPKIEQLKNTYQNDKVRFNQEIMRLYKTEKVNPMAGCLPIFLQIPIFFSIYKVLNVTIEMRHAPFYGWIKDLSAPDPAWVINLFGLLPFTPPSFLQIGILPAIMCITMYIQQKMSPPSTDPAQQQMMKIMPLMFLFMSSQFPAGLVIYWTWSNILSIAQQYVTEKFK